MIVTLDSKRRLTVPAAMPAKPGDHFLVDFDAEDGAYGRSAVAAAGVLPVQVVSWLLDADVLSQPAKRDGHPRVTAWLETEQDDCYTSAVVLAQLAYWVRSKEGQQRQALQAWLTRLTAALHGRILSFNASVAHVWAEQQRQLERSGRRMPIEDSYIAATARRLQ